MSDLSQKIRDEFLVEDLHVRTPTLGVLEVGFEHNGEWYPLLKFHEHTEKVAIHVRETEEERWGAGQPLDLGDVKVIRGWLRRAQEKKYEEE